MTTKRKFSKSRKVSVSHHKKYTYYNRHVSTETLTNEIRQPTIDDLPNEILFKIFSYIPQWELYFKVKKVCRRWNSIATDPALWKTIRAPEEIPTEVLVEWIKHSSLLTELSIINRNDANIITDVASRYAKRLASFEMLNCWGSQAHPLIYGKNLCNLVTRCPKLKTFNFSNVKFNSRKFFRLMIQAKRRGKAVKKCSYLGPMNAKQLVTLLQTISENRLLERAMVCNTIQKRKIDLSAFIQSSDNEQAICGLWNELLCPAPQLYPEL